MEREEEEAATVVVDFSFLLETFFSSLSPLSLSSLGSSSPLLSFHQKSSIVFFSIRVLNINPRK